MNKFHDDPSHVIRNQHQQDLKTLQKMGCSNSVPRVYSKLVGNIQDHGPAIAKDMNCVVTYKITEVSSKPEKETTFLVDMRKKNDALICLEENF